MNPKAIVRRIIPRAAFALAFDVPRVILALATVAGTLDPEGSAEKEEIDLSELARLRCG
jgi:hypothetical protein